MDIERWRQIEQLYYAALEHPISERAGWLAQRCAADKTLCDDVEKLLAVNEEAGNFLAVPALEVVARKLAADAQVLPPKTHISHYQILGQLGAGGMGVVYRARDTRLHRDVAIKVLPTEFAQDADRLRRFELEARATGSLNHPNILTIYDIGTTAPEEGETLYLVVELLEGEALRTQLNNGALPMKRVIDYAQQIAAGLTAAHAKGIVHRDLKPENLFVTKDGRVKILDFGLAKLMGRQKSERGTRNQADRTLLQDAPDIPPSSLRDDPLTTPGTVIGTVAYMSPEQVRGEAVDHRSDLFSFGLILYEMVTRRRAFEGASMADLMSAILKEEPPELSATNPQIHPQLEKIVQRCLEKKTERRFQTASDLGFALDGLTTPTVPGNRRTRSAQVWATSAMAKRIRWRDHLERIVAGGLALALLVLGVAYVRRTAQQAEPMRLYVNPPEKANFFDWPTISSDGRTLVYVAEVEGKTQLWVRPLGATTARPLVEVNDSLPLPFWSPDGQFIAYFDQFKLKKIALSGGTPEVLLELQQQGGGTWNRDGVILFGGQASGIWKISANGGEPSAVTKLDSARGDGVHLAPVFLPDGRHFLFYISNADPAKNGIYLTSLEGGEIRRLLSVDARTVGVVANPSNAREGYLTFVRDGALMAQSFDFNRNQLEGNPVRIAEQIAAPVGRWARYSLAANGTLVLREKEADEQLTWFDRAGKKLSIVGAPGRYTYPRFSPDGKHLVVTLTNPPALQGDIYLFDLAGGAGTPFTFHPMQDEFPLWSPAGNLIIWDSTREGTTNLFQKAANGAGQDEVLLRSAYHKYLTDWSADGRFILYRELNPQTNWDLWAMPMQGERRPWPWLNSPALEIRATFSPDGKWVAYSSTESGRSEIYVQAFVPGAPASGSKRQLSLKGGGTPFWRRDGRELFYLSSGGRLMSVEITPGADLQYRTAQELFAPSGFRMNADRGYVPTSDGQRFLFVTNADEASVPPFTVVLNWMAEMKR